MLLSRWLCRGNLVGVAPATAAFMAVYEPAKKALAERCGQQASFLGAGAIAGVTASLIRVPTEVVKQRMQVRWPFLLASPVLLCKMHASATMVCC